MVLARRRLVVSLVIAVAVAIEATFLVRGYASARAARTDVRIRRAESERVAVLVQDNARLRAALESLRRQMPAEALEAARAEVAAGGGKGRALPDRDTESKLTDSDRLADGKVLPVSEWKNLGRATPQRALETALWAAAGGDVDTFSESLTFMPDGSERAAQALLDALPASERDRYRTPARLIAALTIPDVPLGSVEIREWNDATNTPGESPGFANVAALLTGADHKFKQVNLAFMQRAEGWKLVVSQGVVEKYAIQLKVASAAAK